MLEQSLSYPALAKYTERLLTTSRESGTFKVSKDNFNCAKISYYVTIRPFLPSYRPAKHKGALHSIPSTLTHKYAYIYHMQCTTGVSCIRGINIQIALTSSTQ